MKYDITPENTKIFLYILKENLLNKRTLIDIGKDFGTTKNYPYRMLRTYKKHYGWQGTLRMYYGGVLSKIFSEQTSYGR